MNRLYYSQQIGQHCSCSSGKHRLYRCKECLFNAPWCEDCIIQRHTYEPLHVIQKWTGESFIDIHLFDLGMVVQLGHGGGACPCVGKTEKGSKLRVTDINGLQDMQVVYCSCIGRKAHAMQLMESGIFPSSMRQPKSATTFRCLQDFHLATLVSKKSAFDYVRALCQKTSELPFDGPAVSSLGNDGISRLTSYL